MRQHRGRALTTVMNDPTALGMYVALSSLRASRITSQMEHEEHSILEVRRAGASFIHRAALPASVQHCPADFRLLC